MATNTIVPFTPPVDAEPETVTGEVIQPVDELRAQERIIHKGWKVAQKKAIEVYDALTIIYTRDLWKLHKDADDKRKYKAFDAYLFGEFGWTMTRARAHQIIKERQSVLVEDGVLRADELPAPRARTAPVITAGKAAVTTADQLQKVLEAFKNRLTNVEQSAGRDELDSIYEDAVDAIGPILEALALVKSNEDAANVEGTVEDANSDDDTDNDTDGDSDS